MQRKKLEGLLEMQYKKQNAIQNFRYLFLCSYNKRMKTLKENDILWETFLTQTVVLTWYWSWIESHTWSWINAAKYYRVEHHRRSFIDQTMKAEKGLGINYYIIVIYTTLSTWTVANIIPHYIKVHIMN